MPHETRNFQNKKRRPSEDRDRFSVLCKNASLGASFSLLCATALMLIGALLCLRSVDPLALILPIGLSVLYLSALLGGIITVRRQGARALLCGALCGIFLLVFFWIVALFFRGEASFSFALTFLLRLLIPLFSIFGAFLGQKRAPHRLRRK